MGVVPSMVGAVPSMVGVVPSMGGVVPSMVGVVPSMVGVVASMVGVVPSMVGVVPSSTGPSLYSYKVASRANQLAADAPGPNALPRVARPLARGDGRSGTPFPLLHPPAPLAGRQEPPDSMALVRHRWGRGQD